MISGDDRLEGEAKTSQAHRSLGPLVHLRIAMVRLHSAQRALGEAADERDRLIRESLAAGESISDVADVARMTETEVVALGRDGGCKPRLDRPQV